MNLKNKEKYGCQKVLKIKQNRYKTKRWISSLFEVPFKHSTQRLLQKGKDQLSHITRSPAVKMNKEYKIQSDTISKKSTSMDPLGSHQKIYEGAQYEQSDQPSNIIFFEDTFYRQSKIIKCQNKIDLQLLEIKTLEESSLRR